MLTVSDAKPSQALLDNFWTRMAAMYGHTWASQYGVRPDGVAADTWATALSGVSPQQIAYGMREALAAGSDWPPSAPRFRAMCMGIPSFAAVKHAMRAGDASAFLVLVSRHLDGHRMRHAYGDKADRMLREAYDLACDHVMRGGEMPEPPIAAIVEERKQRKPASPEIVEKHMRNLTALFGGCDEA